MHSTLFRAVALTLILVAALSFATAATLAAVEASPAVDACCGTTPEGVPAEPCPEPGCGCPSCLSALPSGAQSLTPCRCLPYLPAPPPVRTPPAGFSAAIEYPPEAA